MDANTMEYLRLNSSWTITRPLPGALTGISNGSISPGPNTGMILARFVSDKPSDNGAIVYGLGFSTLGGLPVNNSAFGERTVTHTVLGTNIGTSSIEVFYANGSSSHPAGGPLGYETLADGKTPDHSTPDPTTPNWVYYYNQAYPFWLPVEYVNSNKFAGLFQGSTPGHIHVGNQAHGVFAGPLLEMQGGSIHWIGYAQTYGIDTYARVLNHEAEHKQMYDINYTDYDNDGVDDNYELGIGLDPLHQDTLGLGAYLAQQVPGNLYTAANGDKEAVARLAENGKTGPREADWADDGLNHGATPGPLAADRVKKWDFNNNPL